MTPTARAVADLAAKVADSGRLMRGRLYHRQGAVNTIAVEAGRVKGAVGGSGGQVYQSSISCDEAPGETSSALLAAVEQQREVGTTEVDAIGLAMDALASSGGDELIDPDALRFRCSCLDGGDPCKHGVALLLAFADAVNDDALDLLTFRSVPLNDSPGESMVGAASTPEAGASNPSAAVNPVAEETVAESEEVQHFFAGLMPAGEIDIPSMLSLIHI